MHKRGTCAHLSPPSDLFPSDRVILHYSSNVNLLRRGILVRYTRASDTRAASQRVAGQ